MHLFQNVEREQTARDFWLIRKHDTVKPGAMQALHLFTSVVNDEKIFEPKRRAGYAVDHDFADENSIAVQEHRACHRPMLT
jgi:hypothetical protein